MPNLLAMSFEGALAPSFDLQCLHHGEKLPDGWGIGYYPGGEPSVVVLKEAAPREESIRGELVRAWENVESSLFVVHIRTAKWGQNTNANTQPFTRAYGGREWVFSHAGSLHERLDPRDAARFSPVGSTDSERIFCELLDRFAERGWQSIGDADADVVRGWLGEVNTRGTLNVVFSDGRDMVVYADQVELPMYICQLLPPHGSLRMGDGDLTVDLAKRGIRYQKGLLVCTEVLEAKDTPSDEAPKSISWQPLARGELVVVRQGAIAKRVLAPETLPEGKSALPGWLLFRLKRQRPKPTSLKRYEIVHRTVYNYQNPVGRSSHLFRLEPRHDLLQRLLSFSLKVQVGDGSRDLETRDFEDVFGNRAMRALIVQPYTELSIEARSVVEMRDTDPLSFKTIHARTGIPLVWMPWQRQILQPYLLPPELPETELAELSEYAMSFVERNDYDLFDTLLDINTTIFTEYEYKQGSTNLFTTPYQVYAQRRGVCQDFANLFICLARLLEVPARYACGYVFTGPKHPNFAQSEASHAWVQVYLPETGWKGFDPTNGILTQTDHVRVAMGRSYIDTTPTSGTIYVGGGGESLSVHVRIEESVETKQE